MSGSDWSRAEVEAIVEDYFEMLSRELSGAAYSKTVHRRALLPRLNGRSAASVEFKHANISAALIDLRFPPIAGYKPRSNYQTLLAEVVVARLGASSALLDIAAADADRPMAVPEVDDILSVLSEKPEPTAAPTNVRDVVAIGARCQQIT